MCTSSNYGLQFNECSQNTFPLIILRSRGKKHYLHYLWHNENIFQDFSSPKYLDKIQVNSLKLWIEFNKCAPNVNHLNMEFN